ncbi:hypothetical protein K437DRAFT_274474 [Tilletiaria anomala UBC 951]|uniref:Uncharacterized protein n=1 Tax=Tilletiaria anomala (strain ATCC 24038 / CBS 436.72 / UBC 951) TaxID=1037660 RepID=A0A066W1L3_TILAU|nr:uncharacterized protein K437DRAFT_274474 [Tilletiaria anomala UBC 951]KDN44685.1 hypothetical protein K437DRAFT_274474 [Tilletiaria anomala UBC 951]
MVLQNKYKARASAKYQSSRGNRGWRGGARGRGNGVHRGTDIWDAVPAAVPDEEGDVLNDDEDVHGESDAIDEGESPSEFRPLQATAKAKENSAVEDVDEEVLDRQRQRQKYGRRKIESNIWRFQQCVKDPHMEDSVSEPEVDISGLVERVKQLDTSRAHKNTVSLGFAEQEEAEDIEEDIDHSLAYLKGREQQRRKGKGHGVEDDWIASAAGKGGVDDRQITHEERQRLAEETEEMLKEKEKAEALRALKERFLGRAIGERESKARTAILDPGARVAVSSKPVFKIPSSKGANEDRQIYRNDHTTSKERPKPQVESDQDFLDAMLG